jgi:hypothetical protein
LRRINKFNHLSKGLQWHRTTVRRRLIHLFMYLHEKAIMPRKFRHSCIAHISIVDKNSISLRNAPTLWSLKDIVISTHFDEKLDSFFFHHEAPQKAIQYFASNYAHNVSPGKLDSCVVVALPSVLHLSAACYF